MSVLRPLALVTACSLTLASTAVFAQQNRGAEPPQGFLYGVGVGINQEIYRGYKRRVIPLPLVGYRGEKLSVYGPFVTYELAKANDVSLSAKLAPRFAGYDDSDSDVFVRPEQLWDPHEYLGRQSPARLEGEPSERRGDPSDSGHQKNRDYEGGLDLLAV